MEVCGTGNWSLAVDTTGNSTWMWQSMGTQSTALSLVADRQQAVPTNQCNFLRFSNTAWRKRLISCAVNSEDELLVDMWLIMGNSKL